MPEIELPPSRARRVIPLNKPLAVFHIAVAAGFLVWIYFTRSGSAAEFELTIFMAFAIGVLVAGLMRNIN